MSTKITEEETIDNLMEAVKEDNELYTIVEKNKIIVDYTGEDLDNMEEIPNWQNLMEVYVKLYEEFKDLLEDGYEYTNPFEYGPNRFFVWSTLGDLIQELTEEEL